MILLNLRLLSELPLARELGRRLTAQGEAVAWCAETEDAAAAAEIARAAATQHARYVNLAAYAAEAEAAGTSAGLTTRLRSLFRSSEDKDLDDSPRGKAFLIALSHQLTAARRVIDEVQPDLLVVFQDGVSANHALIRAAVDAYVPILDCPYGSGTTQDFDDYLDEKAAENNLNLADGPFGERVKREYPHWVRSYQQRDVLMYPAEYVLVRERLGLGLPLPWVIHGGLADVLAAESEVMRCRYVSEGVRADKVRLTGTVYCDVMFDQLRAHPDAAAAFEQSAKLRAGQTSMLVSLPPSLHDIRGRYSEFPSHEAACDAIVNMCVRHGVSAAISLHPNAPPSVRDTVAASGLPVITDWVVAQIPRFDIFFTTYSSTIRWAIACGKPVLNYNMYGYRCPDYDAVSGVTTRHQLADIEAALVRLLDDATYGAVAARQQTDGKAWGMLDGRNFERIYETIGAMRTKRRQETRQ